MYSHSTFKRYLRVIAITIALLVAVLPGGNLAPAKSSIIAAELGQPPLSGESAVVLDGNNGDILYEKNAHIHVPPASVTKIVTAIVAIEEEKGRLDQRIPIDFDSYEMVVDSQSTVMGLKPGDNPTLRDLLYGMMLPSGNDAAVVIARFVGGSERRFAEMMNEKMRSLGLVDSHFANPHGLDADDHYSSAYDMAALSLYGMRYSLFRSLSEAVKYEVKDVRTYDVWNLNRLLYSYDGADGVKIGYTENALETIVASATRGQHKLMVAVMRSNSRYSDARALLDYYFKALETGEVTRIPAPTPVPTPTTVAASVPNPDSSSPVDREPGPAVAPSSLPPAPPVAAAPQKDFWTGLADGIGSFFGGLLQSVGIGS